MSAVSGPRGCGYAPEQDGDPFLQGELMTDGNGFNERNIAELCANHGRVGGQFEGAHALQAERYPGFGEYRRNTSRTIPVVALTPTSRAEPRT